MARSAVPAAQNGLAIAARTFGSPGSGRRPPETRLERGIGQVDGRRPGVLRRAGIPRGTPHELLVQKVLERMMIDQARRIAF